jgi:hypothetical protein
MTILGCRGVVTMVGVATGTVSCFCGDGASLRRRSGMSPETFDRRCNPSAVDSRRSTAHGPPLDPTAALPEGLVAADRSSTVVFHGDFVIIESGIGRVGTSGWSMRHAVILNRPTDEELGEAISNALATSYKEKHDAPLNPVSYGERDQWRRVGASSETAFINASRLVTVHQRNRRLFRASRTFFYPSRLVPREGHSTLVERELISVDTSALGIGRGVREALELCR